MVHVSTCGATAVIYGYASVFDCKDAHNDVIKKGAFERSLQTWRARALAMPLLWSHDFQNPIGRVEALHEDVFGLFIKAELTLGVGRAREAVALLTSGAVRGLSIGFHITDAYNNRSAKCRVIEGVELVEVSLVTLPANEQAMIVGG